MAPGTHAFISWWTANVEPLTRRDRLVLFLAGVLPDLDGITRFWNDRLYFTYHHVLCHNLLGCVIWTAVVAATAQKRLVCATLAVLNWHLHLVCDYFGSGGGEGTIWVLPYLFPAVGGWAGDDFVGPSWYWNPWQWPLNGWQNLLITVVGAVSWVCIGVRLNRTWFEFISPWFDGEVCKMLRRWFGGAAPVEQWPITTARWVRGSFLILASAAVLACVIAATNAGGVSVSR